MMELFHEYFDKLFLVVWLIFMICVVRWGFALNARYGNGEPE